MKRNALILAALLLLSSFSFSQERKRLVLKEHGWFTISLGTTIMTSFAYIEAKHGKESDVERDIRIGGLVFAQSIGVTLHIISWKLEPTRKPVYKTKHPRWL